jgi:hypothetical protein
LSRKFRLNYVISFIFYLYLILYAYVQRFDVIKNLKKFYKILGTKQHLTGIRSQLSFLSLSWEKREDVKS